jgi:hypothetical protein
VNPPERSALDYPDDRLNQLRSVFEIGVNGHAMPSLACAEAVAAGMPIPVPCYVVIDFGAAEEAWRSGRQDFEARKTS